MRRETDMHLPLSPVKQAAVDDVEVLVTFEDGHAEIHRYRPGAWEWLECRYNEPTAVSGQPWTMRLAEPNGNGDRT